MTGVAATSHSARGTEKALSHVLWFYCSLVLTRWNHPGNGVNLTEIQQLGLDWRRNVSFSMIIYRMVIVEGRCTKLQLLISYIV